MSKGYLYDTGDELITRDGNPELLDVGSIPQGSSIIKGSDGNFSYNLIIPVTFKASDKKLYFADGYTCKDIQDCIAKKGHVYFAVRVLDSATYNTYTVGNVIKVDFVGGTNLPHVALYKALVSFTIASTTATLTFINFLASVSGLTATSNYIAIADDNITSITATVAT